VALIADPESIVQNTDPFQTMADQVPDAGNVPLSVQVIPSGEVYVSRLPVTQNTEPFQAMAVTPDNGSTCAVQVIPSGEVAATVDEAAIAQNTEPFQAAAVHVTPDAYAEGEVITTPSCKYRVKVGFKALRHVRGLVVTS
jgi:hypothetical protein